MDDKQINVPCMRNKTPHSLCSKQLNIYDADLIKSHLKAIKRVVWYLKETMQIKLIFGSTPTNPPLYTLTDYADSNFDGDTTDQKLVIAYCFLFNRAIIL